ncbi:MAG TPA: hypothetical protein VM580_22015 [Labilithrix sp.]|jgi:hypothetical protein|nr:hypothetical protein [Labilithrix sp.]
MSRRALFAVLFASSTALLACSAAPGTDDVESDDGEEISETSSALMNNGGSAGNGLTAAECTACGCSLVLDHKTDNCRYYKCVCDSEAKAKCAGSKAASLISVPNPVRSVVGFGGTAGVLAPN